MYRGVPLVIIALTGSSAACFRTDKCGQPPTPNGRNQELMFAVELGYDLSEGLTQDILIPERVDGSRADTWRLTEPFQTTNEACDDPFIADFADTTLEAIGNDVLEVVEVRRLGTDYVVKVRCAPGPYPVETQISGDGGVSRTTQRSGAFEVRLLAGGALRYADSYGVRCWQTDELRLVPDKDTLVVGEMTNIYHSLYAHWEYEPPNGVIQTARQELVGAGLVILGDLPPIQADRDYGTFMPVIAVRPGANPTLAAGTLEQVVMLTVTE